MDKLVSPVTAGAAPFKRPLRRRILRLAVIAFSIYVSLVTLISLFQRHLIYYPSREYEGLPTDVGHEFEEVAIRAADGVKLAGWYVPCPDDKATVLFFHGNAGNISHRLHKIDLLHRLGFSVFIIDYRGFGKSEGRPSEQGLYRDADAAWEYLTNTRGIPAERIVVMGKSLGGAVAIDLAGRRTPGALVVESTFTTLLDVARIHFRFLPVKLILRDRFESIHKIGAVRCPLLILHGTEDRLIPIDLAKSLFQAAPEPKRFIATPGDHNEAGFSYNLDYATMMAQFVEQAMP